MRLYDVLKKIINRIVGAENSITSLNNSITSLNNSMYYKSGDVIDITQQIALAGFITNGTKDARFTVPLSKRLDKISSITVDSFKGGIRTSQGGYLDGVQDSQEWKGRSGITITATRNSSCNTIYVLMSKTTAYTTVANNTPVVGAMYAKFTLH